MFEIRRYSTVASTNDIIKELAKEGACEGVCAIADAQTNGRGRMGRAFFSPCASGLYMSLLLRPRLCASDALLITTAAAVASAKAIEKHTKKPTFIKWVNDIFQGGKKVCGILAEGAFNESGSIEYVVLGIGVNIEVPKGGFGDLEGIAGALDTNEKISRDDLAFDILSFFEEYYKKLENKPHFEEYVKRDMLAGKEVTVLSGGIPLYSARAIEIDNDFSLIVEHEKKKTAIFSGEVSVKIKS